MSRNLPRAFVFTLLQQTLSASHSQYKRKEPATQFFINTQRKVISVSKFLNISYISTTSSIPDTFITLDTFIFLCLNTRTIMSASIQAKDSGNTGRNRHRNRRRGRGIGNRSGATIGIDSSSIEDVMGSEESKTMKIGKQIDLKGKSWCSHRSGKNLTEKDCSDNRFAVLLSHELQSEKLQQLGSPVSNSTFACSVLSTCSALSKSSKTNRTVAGEKSPSIIPWRPSSPLILL